MSGHALGRDRPFYRTARQFTDGLYTEGGRSGYIRHPKYADSPSRYIRAFELLQKDLLELFEFIEPADENLGTYSFRTFELLLRACTELEANCKAIFRANKYSRDERSLNITDYYKINKSHFLADYSVRFHYWQGEAAVRQPFALWKTRANEPDPHKLRWYSAYNHSKHDRASQLKEATLEHLLDAMSGLCVVLTAQFLDEDFSPRDDLLSLSGEGDGYESAIGGYFRVRYPDAVPAADRYNFDWQRLKVGADPFVPFDFDAT